MAENINFPSCDDVSAVKCIFPDILDSQIQTDLEVSGSVENTINNILDGTFHTAGGAVADDQFNVGDDDDLPDPGLFKSCSSIHQPMSVPVSTHSDYAKPSTSQFMPISATATRMKYSPLENHALSDSEEENNDIPAPLFERLGFCRDAHAMSDSESSDSGVRSKKMKLDVSPPVHKATGVSVPNQHGRRQNPTGSQSEVNIEINLSGETNIARNTSEAVSHKQEHKRRLQQENIEKKRLKEEEKIKKKQEQAEKRQLKEYEKTKQRTMREAKKAPKPGEAKKQMTVILDPLVLQSSSGTVLLDLFQKQEIVYEIQPQPFPGIMTFWREVTEVIERVPLKLETVKKEVVEDQIILVLPVTEFVQYVHNFKQRQMGMNSMPDMLTLREYVVEVKQVLEDRNVTLVVNGIEKYFRDQRSANQRQHRDHVTGTADESAPKGRGRKKKCGSSADPIVSRLNIEEAMVDIQIHTGCHVRLVNSDKEMSETLFKYTKAIAEAPYKRHRLGTGLSLYIDGSGSVKVTKEGDGVQQLWRQQLQQFKNVSAEVANAIMSEYKTPLDLAKAYEKCSSSKNCESLLQDIVIRRGVGVMATTRRVGKELSRRLFHLFTSKDPDFLLS